jgi:hypothetical protein
MRRGGVGISAKLYFGEDLVLLSGAGALFLEISADLSRAAAGQAGTGSEGRRKNAESRN